MRWWYLSNFKKTDWLLNGNFAVLAFLSALTINSVAPHLFYYQLAWIFLSAITIFIFSQIDWRPLINYRWLVFSIYVFALVLLVITFFLAPSIRGARSWIVLGPIQIQTSELAKLSLIIIFSYFFASRHIGIAYWRNVFASFVYLALPAALVLFQPDLGSVLILFGLWIGFLLVSGLYWRQIILGFLALSLIGFWGWHSFLQDYQRERTFALFNPDYDPLGINYGVIQSKVAIGSAGFWGKGYQQGTQAQLGFLPEAATDFIFSAFTEEWGLAGALALFSLFILMVFRIVKIGITAGNNFSRLICVGAVILFLLHFIFNIGSSIGLVPVVGVPLPFFSYGGSNFLVNAALLGMIQSIIVRAKY